MAKTTLYLMRHAEADSGDVMDAGRQLTGDGKKDFAATLQLAKDAGARPDCVMCSPFDRGKDSAAMVADFFGLKKKDRVETPDLLPDADVAAAWAAIATELADYEETLVVTHQPLLGQLVNKCLGVSGLSARFKTSGMMRVDFDQDAPSTSVPSGILRWFVVPKIVPSSDEADD